MSDETRTSAEWMKHPEFTGTTILSPDGWNQANYEYSFNREPITRAEFIERLLGSTISRPPNWGRVIAHQWSAINGNP